MVTSQVLAFVNSPKTQKSKYIQKQTIFSPNNKNPVMIHLRLKYGKNGFLAKSNFKIDMIVSLNADVQQLSDCESTFSQKRFSNIK